MVLIQILTTIKIGQKPYQKNTIEKIVHHKQPKQLKAYQQTTTSSSASSRITKARNRGQMNGDDSGQTSLTGNACFRVNLKTIGSVQPRLTVERDRSFYCKCHGSTFDPDGHVTEGPARRDLPLLPAYTNEQGQLIVNIPAV